ncbi:MAG: hypothetical protein HY049_04625 [Acidobacteria bacterium]|nr:hypothetical protein [Acidobacteriota bacterium]
MTRDPSLPGWLPRLGALRDGLLVLASILYGLGYLVWSIYAWDRGLGLLPALDAQYFIAGMFPAFVGVAGFCGFRLIVRSIEHFLDWLYSGPKTRAKTVTRRIAYAVVLVAGLLLGVSRLSGRLKDAIDQSLWMPTLFGLLLLGSIFYHRDQAEAASRLSRLYRDFQVGNIVAGAALAGVVYFIGSIYPQLPQELGGVRPRCVYLDLDTAKLSLASLPPLVGAGQLQASGPVARSVALELLYSSRDILVVRTAGRVYELDRGAVHTIASCE